MVRVLLCVLAAVVGVSGRRTLIPRGNRPEPASTIAASDIEVTDEPYERGDAISDPESGDIATKAEPVVETATEATATEAEPVVDEARKSALAKARALLAAKKEPVVDEARKSALAKARALLALKKFYASNDDLKERPVNEQGEPTDASAEDEEDYEEEDYGFFQATAMILSPASLFVFSLVVAVGSYFGLFELRSKAEILMDTTMETSDEKIKRLEAELKAQRSGSEVNEQEDPEEKRAAKVRDLMDLAADPACLSELLAEAVPAPGDTEESDMTDLLPAVATYRDAVTGDSSKDFSIMGEEIVFDRCYVLKGAVPAGRFPEEALESMQQRVEEISTQGNVQLFLQPAVEPGVSLLVAVLESDLPSKKVEAWQWITFGILFLCTIFSANNLSFLVIGSTNLNLDVSSILFSTVPAAAVVMATVFAQEGARRLAASNHGVELSAPYFLPAFPFAPIGTFGALTQRLSAAPNKVAEFDMAAAASVAGYIVSFGAIVAGIVIGAGPESDVYTVSLNYQLLPVLLRAIARPFLGDASAVDIDTMDPFAFPANPLLVGGLVGAFVNSLLLLPVGSQDGGILARLAFGEFSGTLSMFAYVMMLFGFFGGGEAGQTYVIFAIALVIFKSGLPEMPPKDSVTDIDGAKRAGAVALLGLGMLLSIPGWPFPNV